MLVKSQKDDVQGDEIVALPNKSYITKILWITIENLEIIIFITLECNCLKKD